MANEQISDEAAEWFVTLRYEQPDTGVQQRFMRWLCQSPEHVRAYLETVALWADLPAVDAVKTHDTPASIVQARADNNVVPLQVLTAKSPDAGAVRAHRSDTGRQSQADASRKRTGVRIAACIAFVAAALAGLSWWSNVTMPTYATEIGEQRILRLPDGSSVELNSRSRIRVRFSAHERAVELIEGQALFGVAKDPQRVFLVKSGPAQVRALGTQFDVYRKQGGTVVTVVEGRVAVSPVLEPTAHHDREPLGSGKVGSGSAAGPRPASAGPHPPHGLELTHSEVLLSAGEQVLVAGSSALSPTHANVAAVTSWTHGALMFTSEPLSSVVGEFNRYNAQHIVLEGSVEDFPITATFSSTDPRALIEFLKGQPELRVEKHDGEFHVISTDASPLQN